MERQSGMQTETQLGWQSGSPKVTLTEIPWVQMKASQ
jgi:hypothetical protein